MPKFKLPHWYEIAAFLALNSFWAQNRNESLLAFARRTQAPWEVSLQATTPVHLALEDISNEMHLCYRRISDSAAAEVLPNWGSTL